jgi:hypothetical protein
MIGRGVDSTQVPAATSQDVGRDKLLQSLADRVTRSSTLALLLSPVGILLVSVARLLIISDYNPVTASAIVSSGGYVDALLGTIIPLVPVILPYIALVLLFFNRVIPGILALLAAGFVSPMTMNRSAALNLLLKDLHQVTHPRPPLAVVMILVAVFVFLLLLIELLTIGFSVFARTIATIVCILLIPVIGRLYQFPFNNQFYTQLVRQPWLPAETITMSSGARFTGYVLADDGAWVVVLMEDNRTVAYYSSTDITGRQVCQIGAALPMKPLITLTPPGEKPSTLTRPCQPSPGGQPLPSRPASPAPHIGEPRFVALQTPSGAGHTISGWLGR